MLAINNETKDTLEFPSATSAAKYLNVDESYVRRCINNNKSCKVYTLIRQSEDQDG